MGWRDWKNVRLAVPRIRPRDTWRIAGNDLYTCVAPPGYEKDPAVTAAIHSFDPDVIPAWRIQLWHPPGEDRVIRAVHHGIMRYYPHPRQLRTQFHVEIPQGWEGPVPNFLDKFFDDDLATNFTGPAAYWPWDWRVFRWCYAHYIVLTVDRFQKRLDAAREAKERLRTKHDEEMAYREAFFWKTAEKLLEKITPQDWAEYQHIQETRARRRHGRVSIGLPGTPLGG